LCSLEPDFSEFSIRKLACDPDENQLSELRKTTVSIAENDISTVIYTSGSTGRPRGVMLSHKNLVSNIKSVLAISPLSTGQVAASFLPISHVFERVLVWTYLAAGVNVYFLDNQSLTLSLLKKIRPHFFSAVPRFLEKMHGAILNFKEKSNPVSRKILGWAMAVGEHFPSKGVEQISFRYGLKLWLADWLVFRVWRRQLGGRVIGIVVGASALQPKLARLFSAAKIPIREGYGLTETSPVVSFNRFEPGGNLFGTVGLAVPGVEIRIGEAVTEHEGEIEVRGANVFSGYLNLAAETAAHFTADGWLKTGDVGTFVHKKFLKITGRKREIFKTSSGKFVAPQLIENQLVTSNFIQNSFVFGLNKPSVGALILPDFEALKIWCEKNRVHWTAPQFMVINPKVERLFEEILENFNEKWEPHQRIRHWKLLFEPWSEHSGELTASLKLRRNFLLEKFAEEIDEIYK
jgi:long-chain acyl-CoA synthetase